MPASPVAKKRIDLREVFDIYLQFTPTAGDRDAFDADIVRLHPTLLYDAMQEAKEGRALAGLPTREYRSVIHGIYNRKVKELASLYPFLFTLENALRARLAAEMERRYETKTWWRLVEAELRAGQNPSTMQLVTLTVHRGFITQLAKMVKEVEGEKMNRAKLKDIHDGMTFLCEMNFGQIRYLIKEGWQFFEPIFRPSAPSLKNLTKPEFLNTSQIIRDARNELHHHNPIRERQKVVSACEMLLDYLNYHLESLDRDIRTQQYGRPSFSVKCEARHMVCRPATAMVGMVGMVADGL